jgi:sensor histidine kinase YesM
MKSLTQRLSHYLNHHDEWIFIALAIGYSLWELTVNAWSSYLQLLLINALYLLPVISFKAFQLKLNTRLKPSRYRILWFLVFIFYPIALFDLKGILLLIAAALELLLIANYSFKHIEPLKIGLNRVGLDGAVIAFLVFFSLYLGLLITSDLSGWIESNSIQTTINFTLVAQNILTFLSISLQMFCLFFCGFIFYWINRHILVNKVLAQRGMVIYFLALVAVLVFLYPLITTLFLWLPINYMGEPLIPSVTANPFDWHNGRVVFGVMLLSLPVILMTQWHQNNSQLVQLEKDNIQTELSLLKQQIDPHFLFNTLNNLYALCRKKSALAPDVVLQLAELMRYVVYRGKESYVLCSEEAKYIEDYISLQSIRLHNHLALEVQVNIEEPQAKIPPLLLIILVENAFKHGIEPATQECFLKINLQISSDFILFTCENSVEYDDNSEDKVADLKMHFGVGLENLQRRLNLLYLDKHQLTLQPKSNSFMAKLKLSL